MAAVGNGQQVTAQGFSIERYQDSSGIMAAEDGFRADAIIEVAVPAHDVGMVFALPEYVESIRCTDTPENIRQTINAAALRTPNSPGYLVYVPWHKCSSIDISGRLTISQCVLIWYVIS